MLQYGKIRELPIRRSLQVLAQPAVGLVNNTSCSRPWSRTNHKTSETREEETREEDHVSRVIRQVTGPQTVRRHRAIAVVNRGTRSPHVLGLNALDAEERVTGPTAVQNGGR